MISLVSRVGPLGQAEPVLVQPLQEGDLLVGRDAQRAVDPEGTRAGRRRRWCRRCRSRTASPAAPRPAGRPSSPARGSTTAPIPCRRERSVWSCRQASREAFSAGSYFTTNSASAAAPVSSRIAVFGILNVEHGAKRWSARAAFQRVNAPVWPSSSTNVPSMPWKCVDEVLRRRPAAPRAGRPQREARASASRGS